MCIYVYIKPPVIQYLFTIPSKFRTSEEKKKLAKCSLCTHNRYSKHDVLWALHHPCIGPYSELTNFYFYSLLLMSSAFGNPFVLYSTANKKQIKKEDY